MKQLKISFYVIFGVIMLQSCGGGQTTETTETADSIRNSSTTTADSNTMMSNTDMNTTDSSAMSGQASGEVNKECKDFAMKAASGGMMEVEAGKLAQQNAKSQRVKDFGSMMVADHGKANDELKSLASSKNLTVPAAMMPEHQKHLDMMSKMKGAEFDKHYMDMMLNDHKKDISDFKKEAGHPGNDPFKDFASKTLPVLQKHLDSAQAIHGKM